MRIPFLLCLFAYSFSLQGMETNEFTAYQIHCTTIKTFLEREKNEFFEMIYNKSLDPAQELTRIDQQFAHYKEALHKERNASLLQLKKFHNISDQVWLEGMKDIEDTKKQVTDYINTKRPDAEHSLI